MQIVQITFVTKNPKCISIKPKRYLINTKCTFDALEEAEKLLSEEKHADRYKPLPALIMEVHEA